MHRTTRFRFNGFEKCVVFNERCTCFDNVVIIPHDITITSDLNFHVDNKSDVDASRFCSILDCSGLK